MTSPPGKKSGKQPKQDASPSQLSQEEASADVPSDPNGTTSEDGTSSEVWEEDGGIDLTSRTASIQMLTGWQSACTADDEPGKTCYTLTIQSDLPFRAVQSLKGSDSVQRMHIVLEGESGQSHEIVLDFQDPEGSAGPSEATSNTAETA